MEVARGEVIKGRGHVNLLKDVTAYVGIYWEKEKRGFWGKTIKVRGKYQFIKVRIGRCS